MSRLGRPDIDRGGRSGDAAAMQHSLDAQGLLDDSLGVLPSLRLFAEKSVEGKCPHSLKAGGPACVQNGTKLGVRVSHRLKNALAKMLQIVTEPPPQLRIGQAHLPGVHIIGCWPLMLVYVPVVAEAEIPDMLPAVFNYFRSIIDMHPIADARHFFERIIHEMFIFYCNLQKNRRSSAPGPSEQRA